MKKIFSCLISGVLALSVLGVGQASGAARAQRRAGTRAATIRFASREIKEDNKKLRYTVSAKYPQALGARDPRLERLNHAIRSLITEQVGGFKKDFQPPEERMTDMGSYFDTEYAVDLATNELVSISFYVNTYYEGAAHPNHNAVTFNYWFETGKTLTLADLFKSNSNYLRALSNYSVRVLKRKLSGEGSMSDSDWIQRGAGPEAENYQNWSITRRGLKITFDPYQVAAYAAGEHEVLIPYSVLKGVINPDGPLAGFVR